APGSAACRSQSLVRDASANDLATNQRLLPLISSNQPTRPLGVSFAAAALSRWPAAEGSFAATFQSRSIPAELQRASPRPFGLSTSCPTGWLCPRRTKEDLAKG